jgi:hypothetical protein
MENLIKKLPIEVLYIIMSYSYQYQPLELRNDLISYYKTKNIIRNIFYLKYYLVLSIQKDFDLINLIFHLHCYNTGLQNIYTGCENKIYDLCNRNYMYSNNKNYSIINLINIAYPVQNHQLRFGTIWGLFTHDERNKFIAIHLLLI